MDELEKLKKENEQLRLTIKNFVCKSKVIKTSRGVSLIQTTTTFLITNMTATTNSNCTQGCMSKESQAVYDAIKRLREGFETTVTINGETYKVLPWERQEQEADGYCQLVLCKYHGRKIGVQWICWKDAGPNPRLCMGMVGFIPFKNIYGVVRHEDWQAAQNG